MIRILHNPRCMKSREGLELVRKSRQDFTVVPYLEEPPTPERLRKIISYLGIRPIELVRTNEKVWKENYKGKNLTDEAIINAMSDNPKLIERPIVIKGKRAVIGRPPEKISEFLKSTI